MSRFRRDGWQVKAPGALVWPSLEQLVRELTTTLLTDAPLPPLAPESSSDDSDSEDEELTLEEESTTVDHVKVLLLALNCGRLNLSID